MTEIFIVESWEDGSNDPPWCVGVYRKYESALQAVMSEPVYVDEKADWKQTIVRQCYWEWVDGRHYISILRHEVQD